MTDRQEASHQPKVVELRPEPSGLIAWLRELWSFRQVIWILTRKDFQVRYKRAAFGVLWAVALPLVQASIFVVVFSRVGHFNHTPFSYAGFVLAGVLTWSYFSSTIQASSTAIVDSSSLTDKVWFPRAVLVLVPAISNLFGLITSMVIVIIAIPVVHAHYTVRLLLLPVGMLLMVTFAVSLGLITSALHVYFRDVRFIIQASVLVWFYVTPIVYPATALHGLASWMAINPMTGIISLFQLAVAGPSDPLLIPLAVSIGVSVVFLMVGVEATRRYDRLFVDKL
ncbi:MAG TPA: ABC transporter permease [Acidimicrobiales bacterium]|jgi:ABC-type polysaccharide/polyol phosphate export permease